MTTRPSLAFARDAVTLAAGAGLAQALSLVAAPLLARLYSPAEFGDFALYSFLVTIPATLACLNYEPAIVIPREAEDARDVASLSMLFAGAATVLAAVAALVSVLWWPPRTPATLIALVPLNLLALAVFQVLTYWLNRVGDFRGLATTRFAQTAGGVGFQVALGFLGLGAFGLAAGQLAGQASASTFLWVRGQAREAHLTRRLDTGRLVRAMKQFRRFPLYTSWGTLAMTTSFQVIPVLMTPQFGTAKAGLYFFGYRLVSAGSQLVSTSVTQVLYHRAATRLRSAVPLAPFVKKAVGLLMVFAVAVGAGVALLSEPAFALVFGEKWRESGRYMAIVIPIFCAQMVASPVSSILFLIDRQRLASLIQAALLVGTVVTLTASSRFHFTPEHMLELWTLTQTITYMVYLILTIRAAESAGSRPGSHVMELPDS